MAGQVTVLKFLTLISHLYIALDSSSFVVIDSFSACWRDTGTTRGLALRFSGYSLASMHMADSFLLRT